MRSETYIHSKEFPSSVLLPLPRFSQFALQFRFLFAFLLLCHLSCYQTVFVSAHQTAMKVPESTLHVAHRAQGSGLVLSYHDSHASSLNEDLASAQARKLLKNPYVTCQLQEEVKARKRLPFAQRAHSHCILWKEGHTAYREAVSDLRSRNSRTKKSWSRGSRHGLNQP